MRSLCFFLLISNICFAAVPQEQALANPAMADELTILDGLISRTQKQLATQMQLKDLMIQFKVQKQLFTKGNQSKKHAFDMVKTASKILDILSNEQLKHLFSTDYLEELALFSSIANKATPAKP
ncbi:MAG TPA: hypothetical protein VLF61_04610 [Rhabdochlamydiaceae bacterium]|nr:hypothetical protein [Rhabdochlamydiaceae bacterium]